MTRPGWLDSIEHPFESLLAEVDGERLHDVNEGDPSIAMLKRFECQPANHDSKPVISTRRN